MIIVVGSQKAGRPRRPSSLTSPSSSRSKAKTSSPWAATRSVRWHADRIEAGHHAAIAAVEKLGNLYSTLKDLDGRYDVVLVDVAGNDSKEMCTAMTAAHRLVVTVRPSQLGLDTLPHMSELIEQAQDLNPDLIVRGLVTQAPNGSERTDAGEYLEEYPLVAPLETIVYERKAYRVVIGEGLGVVEWNKPKARAEVQELAGEVIA